MNDLERIAQEEAALRAKLETELKARAEQRAALIAKRGEEIGKLADRLGVLTLPDDLLAGALIYARKICTDAEAGSAQAAKAMAELKESGAPFLPAKRGRKGKADVARTAANGATGQAGAITPQPNNSHGQPAQTSSGHTQEN
jgi:hypothetical protein